ncbi:MAG: shikimate dehydrogenase [Acidisphaera sp.]|nr:shikimate dehydrogenase [Acidisphaera sp.]
MPIPTGKARVAGVLGWPVAHSRSPRLHGFWLDRFGIDGAYIPLPTRPEAFASAVRGLRDAGFAGANVTLPHKEAAFALCDTVEPTASRAGAVNTLVFRDGRIVGSNTDGFGFIADLRAHGIEPAAGPALVLGSGGATRAVAAALQDAGAAVSIAGRNAARAGELAAELGLAAIRWEDREDALADQAILVNATTAGMIGQAPLAIDLSRAPGTLVVADLVYVPLETPLLRQARQAGLRALDGLGMLLHQARPGFRAWFGVDPVVDEALYNFVAADLLPSAS